MSALSGVRGHIIRLEPSLGRRDEPAVLERVEQAIDFWCEAIRETEDWSTTSDLIKTLMPMCEVRNELKIR
jgi:hypothetical protein